MSRYDLIEINGVEIPDVKKGTLSITPTPKYEAHDTEGGGKVVDVIEDAQKMISGSVSFSGLMQDELQTIDAALDVVSSMKIYNPRTNLLRQFTALINPQSITKIIHEGAVNAWSYGFDFEEIGDGTDAPVPPPPPPSPTTETTEST